MEKPSVFKKGTRRRKNLESDHTANKRSTLTNVHNHLGRVMLSVNKADVGKTDDRTTKVINTMLMTLVVSGKIQSFNCSPFK